MQDMENGSTKSTSNQIFQGRQKNISTDFGNRKLPV